MYDHPAKFQRELREMKDRLLEIRWNVLVQNVKHGRVAVGEVPAQQK